MTNGCTGCSCGRRTSDGNPAGVESVMSELIRLVADDIEPFDSVHPSTMDLYRR